MRLVLQRENQNVIARNVSIFAAAIWMCAGAYGAQLADLPLVDSSPAGHATAEAINLFEFEITSFVLDLNFSERYDATTAATLQVLGNGDSSTTVYDTTLDLNNISAEPWHTHSTATVELILADPTLELLGELKFANVSAPAGLDLVHLSDRMFKLVNSGAEGTFPFSWPLTLNLHIPAANDPGAEELDVDYHIIIAAELTPIPLPSSVVMLTALAPTVVRRRRPCAASVVC